jgi:hypothetical protein
MPDTGRKLLLDHTPRGLATTSGCAPVFLMVFGLPFMGVGVVVALIAKGVITPSRGNDMPGWLGWAVAVIFSLPGAFVFVKGFKGLFDAARLKRAREQHPNEPWLVEYAWDPEGISADSRASALSQVAILAFLLVFLAPFNYFVFFGPDSSEAPLFARGLIALFDLIPVLMVWGIVTTLWHKAKYGQSRLAFGSFPFYLGGSLTARFSTRRAIGEFKKMTFTLRCVEEHTEVYRTTRGSSAARTKCNQIWADEVVLDRPGALYDGELPISFKLPDGDYGSRFVDAPARYWELEVKADTPGLDFGALFLLPVYPRPRY